MSTQWARHEAHKDALAGALQRGLGWVQANRQKALMGAGALLAVLIVGAVAGMRWSQRKEASWERLAIAQSLAYQGKPEATAAALDQIKALEGEFGGSAPAGYGALFAGDILYRQGKYLEAAGHYQGLIDRGGPPGAIPFAMNSLALAQEAAGDCKAAAQTAQGFLDANQDHFLAPQVHSSLARCLESMGQPEKAKASLERMALLYPDTYWAQWAKSRLQK